MYCLQKGHVDVACSCDKVHFQKTVNNTIKLH